MHITSNGTGEASYPQINKSNYFTSRKTFRPMKRTYKPRALNFWTMAATFFIEC